MIVDIEVLVVGIIILIVIVWGVWNFITGKIYLWRYKKKYAKIDKGRKAEEKRRAGIGELGRESGRFGFGESQEAVSSDAGPTEFEQRSILSPASSSLNGEAGNSPGKTRRKFRNPFRRR